MTMRGASRPANVGLLVMMCGAIALACGQVNDSAGAQPDGGEGGVGSAASGGNGSGGAAAGNAGANAGPTAPPADALIKGFDKIEMHWSGGYGPEQCSNGGHNVVLTRDPARLTWAGCDYTKTPSEPTMGEVSLSDADIDHITRGLWKIRTSTASTCGADAGTITFDVTLGSSVGHYADDFYSGCPFGPLVDRTFVRDMSDFANFVYDLSNPTPG